jgi:hypothetical protein
MNTNIIESIEREVRLARDAVREAEVTEAKSGYDIDATIDRARAEGAFEALEWALRIVRGDFVEGQENRMQPFTYQL